MLKKGRPIKHEKKQGRGTNAPQPQKKASGNAKFPDALYTEMPLAVRSKRCLKKSLTGEPARRY